MKQGINAIVRDEVLARDKHKCRKCAKPKKLELHHIMPTAQGGLSETDNLITLCTSCHREWEHIVYPNTSVVTFEQWLDIPPALALIALFVKGDMWSDDITARDARDLILSSYQWMAPYIQGQEEGE